ncbi:hypothetical protein BLNAU_23145 [Blattamonas nauphoetae]|uniref:Uncharacterized protein n=1 Tax=Blattamonas nauphoetae TaxID=2049346 RepID=A0ABQ9WRJ2_9EUKA|nr:hypothetical protein BLNAU_23145 [Blattamonas nauphoetae]
MDHRDPHRVVDGNLVFELADNIPAQIITHQDSEFYPGLWKEFTQFVADRGRMTLIDIIINARPDPGSDGLVHADTHLTMAKCVPQNVPSALFAKPTCSPTLFDHIAQGTLHNSHLFDDGERVQRYLRYNHECSDFR